MPVSYMRWGQIRICAHEVDKCYWPAILFSLPSFRPYKGSCTYYNWATTASILIVALPSADVHLHHIHDVLLAPCRTLLHVHILEVSTSIFIFFVVQSMYMYELRNPNRYWLTRVLALPRRAQVHWKNYVKDIYFKKNSIKIL